MRCQPALEKLCNILTCAGAHWGRAIAANVESKADKSQERFHDARSSCIVGSYIVLRLGSG